MTRQERHPQRVIVIGGGIAGLMSAFHILSRMPKTELTVVDKGKFIPNPFGSSSRSNACTRQQFGTRLNVEMSLYSTRFYERFGDLTGETMRMLWQVGYLFLYRESQRWQAAQRQVLDQQSWGLKEVRALSAEETWRQFPFVARERLLGATFCPTDGFLDAGIILEALKKKLKDMDARILTSCEVESLEIRKAKVRAVKLTSNLSIPCDMMVNCTGAWSSRIGKMLGTELRVAPEKRYLYSAVFRDRAEDFPEDAFRRIPMTVCMAEGAAVHCKPEPGKDPHSFTVGSEHQTDPQWDFLDEDQDYVEPGFEANNPAGFHARIWQELTTWLPFAEKLGFRNKVNAGFYETTQSHSPVIGFDSNCSNVIHCVGFSGHGLMHGPAGGEIVGDLVQFGAYRRFPLAARNLTFESLVQGTRELEGMKI